MAMLTVCLAKIKKRNSSISDENRDCVLENQNYSNDDFKSPGNVHACFSMETNLVSIFP
jgi:hypothetical protein